MLIIELPINSMAATLKPLAIIITHLSTQARLDQQVAIISTSNLTILS